MTLENANRLAELRRAHGYSQEDLADRLGLSRQAISKWERGEASPDTDNLIALSELYGITLDSLLGRGEMTENGGETVAPARVNPFQSEDFDPENPLPEGSYYEHQAEKKRKEKRQRFERRFPFPFVMNSAYLVLAITFAYLLMGCLFHWWHPGWIIFLTIPLFYLPPRERHPLRLLGNPVMVTIIYLLLGFECNLWHPGWLIFFLIPLLYVVRI